METPQPVLIEILSSEDETVTIKKSKPWVPRPDNWMEIAAYYRDTNNVDSTVKQYWNEFKKWGGNSTTENYHRLASWARDCTANKTIGKNGGKPICGEAVDKQLLKTILKRNDLGLPMDPFIMRTLLMIHLRDVGKLQLASEHGGKCKFGESWAHRFLSRHNLKCRVATTKMREIPLDFAQKLEDYIRIGASIIFNFSIPPELVFIALSRR